MSQQSLDAVTNCSIERKQERLQAMLQRARSVKNFGQLFTWLPDGVSAPAGGPLSGLSYSIKDSYQIAGTPLGFGLQLPLERKSAQSAELIELLRNLGASCLGKCSLDEACLNFFGDNPYTGQIFNPVERSRFAGGSSGSVAVTVKTEIVDFGIGSDFGGSIRIPAAACELFGFKFSADSLPRGGALLYDNKLDSPGLLTRRFCDLNYVLTTLLPEDSQQHPENLLVPHQSDLEILSESARGSFEDLCQKLSDRFSITEVSANIFVKAKQLRKQLALEQIKRRFQEWDIGVTSLSPVLQKQFELAKKVSFDPAEQQDLASALKQELEDALEAGAALITPSLGAPVPTRSDQHGISAFQRNGGLFLYPANLLGAPALSAPLRGFHVQIVAAAGRDRVIPGLYKLFSELST